MYYLIKKVQIIKILNELVKKFEIPSDVKEFALNIINSINVEEEGKYLTPLEIVTIILIISLRALCYGEILERKLLQYLKSRKKNINKKKFNEFMINLTKKYNIRELTIENCIKKIKNIIGNKCNIDWIEFEKLVRENCSGMSIPVLVVALTSKLCSTILIQELLNEFKISRQSLSSKRVKKILKKVSTPQK